MNEIDLMDNAYQQYLMNNLLESIETENYVNKCMLICEGTTDINQFNVLNESFGDKVKETITKIINFIVKIWNKFMENLNNIFRNDQGYLEKYKDIILKTKVKGLEYEMPDYPTGIKRISSMQVPALNYPSMKDTLAQGKEEFIKKYFPQLAESVNKGVDFTEYTKTYFAGGSDEKTFKSETLNMTDIYNYVYGYKDFAEKLNKDLKVVQDAGADAKNIVDTAIRNNEIEQGEEIEAEQSSILYKGILDKNIRVFVEADPAGSSESSGGSGKGSDDNNTEQLTAAKFAPKPIDSANQNSTKKDDVAVNKKELVEKQKEKTGNQVLKEIQVYLDTCNAVIASKLTLAEKIHTEYKAIIKRHVRKVLEVRGKDREEKTKDNASNHNINKSNSKIIKKIKELEEKAKKEKNIHNIVEIIESVKKIECKTKEEQSVKDSTITELNNLAKNFNP